MRRVKQVESKADVICENCIFFNENDCNIQLPVMYTPSDSFCDSGQWVINDETLSRGSVLKELKDYMIVKCVEDIICANCIFYKEDTTECHNDINAVYQSLRDSWCSNGKFFFRDRDDEDLIGISVGYFVYGHVLDLENKKVEGPEE